MKIPKTPKFFNFIRCYIFGIHEWTTDFKKRGGKPMEGLDTPEKVKAAMINDAKIYCDYCGHPSELNKRLEDLCSKTK